MTQRLTVIRVKGDTDKLVEAMAGTEEVFERKAPEHGILFSCRARTDDGVIIVNLWPDEDASEKAFQDPEIQEALAKMMSQTDGQPQRDHYDVIDSNSFS